MIIYSKEILCAIFNKFNLLPFYQKTLRQRYIMHRLENYLYPSKSKTVSNDLGFDIPEDILLKLNKLYIQFTNLDDIETELSSILKKMNVEELGVRDTNCERKTHIQSMDFLQHLKDSVQKLSFNNIDFSSCNSDIFVGFNNLKDLRFENCILPDSTINSEQIIVDINDKFNFQEVDCEQLVSILNKNSNTKIKISLANLQKLDPDGNLKVPATVVIENVSELNTVELQKRRCIENIHIISYAYEKDYRSCKVEDDTYTRKEYEKILTVINDIYSQIHIPDRDDPDREKKIFAQVYKILGQRIEYDFKAMSKEGKKDKRLQSTCRNLIGALLDNKCVCKGYSVALKNVLSYFGINSNIVDTRERIIKRNPNSYHSFNIVQLDEKYYFTDLTWDANDIKNNNYPLSYCLKSTEDYETTAKKIKSTLCQKQLELCSESISEEKQAELFEFESLTDLNKSYLSSFATDCANSGLRSTLIQKVADKFKKVKESMRNTIDGIITKFRE